MTLHRLPASHALLARKGSAAPLGLRRPAPEPEDERSEGGTEQAADSAGGPAESRTPVQLALVTGAEAKDAGGAQSEPPPPASMLPFTLHRTRREHGEPWELVSPELLDELAKNAAEAATEQAGSDQSDSPPSKSDAIESAKSESAPPDSAPKPETAAPQAPAPAAPAAALTSAAAASTAPVPKVEPAWRVGVHRLPAERRSGAWHWAGGLAAACLAIAAIAWWSLESQAPTPGAPAPEAATESTAALPQPAAPEPMVPTISSAKPEPAPAPAASSEPETAPASAPASAPAAPQSTEAATEPSAAEIAPSVDLVRIETNGDAVIAGRAAPHSELIVLDNGAPIGTVKADAFGEWVFVPEVPLTQGGHEFGLVLKAEQGKVVVPAAPEKSEGPPPAEEATEAPADKESSIAPLPGRKPDAGIESAVAPLPLRKPDAARGTALEAPIPALKPSTETGQTLGPSPPSADFVVQLASVKTRDGARREWQKLQERFPEVLAGRDLHLQEAKLSQRGQVIRVRTGPFSELGEAVDFCARIRAGQQECLVVRASEQ